MWRKCKLVIKLVIRIISLREGRPLIYVHMFSFLFLSFLSVAATNLRVSHYPYSLQTTTHTSGHVYL